MSNLEVLDLPKSKSSSPENIHAAIHTAIDNSLELSMCKTCGILGFDNAIRPSNQDAS